jgi:hypothetical protein
VLSGEKLKAGERVLRAGSPPASAADTAGALLGFFLVRAGSLDEAETLARGCPHLRHGGTIAVREVDPT